MDGITYNTRTKTKVRKMAGRNIAQEKGRRRQSLSTSSSITGPKLIFMAMIVLSLLANSTLLRKQALSTFGSSSVVVSAQSIIAKNVKDNDYVLNNPDHSHVPQVSSTTQNSSTQSLNQILINAGKRGLGGGLPGAIAGVVQVVTLMWLRTIINYQSRYGTSFIRACSVLYRDGGIPRFYRGLTFALVQAPLARFVSTAANDGVQALLASFDFSKAWGIGRTTFVASIFVGMWRMLLMPIDTCKTVLQVDSKEGFRNLVRRVRAGKIGVLYQGAIANAVSSIMGHYPWFFTYNTLSKNEVVNKMLPTKLLRNAAVGLAASLVSDTVVNAFRVIKTTKQTIGSKHDLSYMDTVRMVVAADGWKGLFGRGLRTRFFANSLQSVMFTIIWRGLADWWATGRGDDHNASTTTDEGGGGEGKASTIK